MLKLWIKGDSGGAVFIKEKLDNMEMYVAVGIVSYGEGCALPNKVGIYTRISYFLQWIYQNI